MVRSAGLLDPLSKKPAPRLPANAGPDFVQIDALEQWMRNVGATYARVGVVELELGPPVPVAETAPPKTDDQVIDEAKRKAEERDRYLFAASEGYPDEVSE